MSRATHFFAIATLLTTACHDRRSAAPSHDAAAASVSVSLPVQDAAIARPRIIKDDGPPPPRHVERKPGCPNFAASMAAARKATIDKAWDRAFDAFDDAVRAKPVDARARAERGYAYFLAGNVDQAKRDMFDAAALTSDKTLLAQTWWNIGTALAATDTEASRIAFVRAEDLGSSAAEKKLGSASRCTAIMSTDVAGDAPIAKGWAELARARAVVNCTMPALEDPNATPRALACQACEYENATADDHCSDNEMSVIDSGYMHFHVSTFAVLPLSHGSFFYSNDIDANGAPDAHEESGRLVVRNAYAEGGSIFHPGGSGLVYGHFHVSGDDAWVRSIGFSDKQSFAWSDELSQDGSSWADDAGAGCAPDMTATVTLGQANGAQMAGTPMIPDVAGEETITWFDIATKKRVFTITTYGAGVTAKLEGNVAHVRGHGCDRDIVLRPAPTTHR